MDISQMLDNPPKNLGHRHAPSEMFMLPDDISFDSDRGVVSGLDGQSLSDETEEDFVSMYLDLDKFNSSFQVGESSSAAALTPSRTDNASEMLISGREEPSAAEIKKAKSAAKLAELALKDPRRAKKIMANRLAAVRSKEKKIRYITELERKVQALQTEATPMFAQLTLLQVVTNGLAAKNSELKLQLQTMEQQVHLQVALYDALAEEMQHLRVLTGQDIANAGSVMNFPASIGSNQQVYSKNHAMHALSTVQQLQQLQIHSHQQQLQQVQVHLLKMTILLRSEGIENCRQ
ncbi:probable transcription factor PosF21 [Lycium ferocissimum]|uniref:probable transcription factor PosF21 n=1 Tax=Lycium ferocissimum TaxID=112874 RepID=UPI0028156CF9|nr:probable transcription factor PosF21 [Lycium ferocissimum]